MKVMLHGMFPLLVQRDPGLEAKWDIASVGRLELNGCGISIDELAQVPQTKDPYWQTSKGGVHQK